MPASRLIDVANIDAGDRLRALDPAWVALLAEDISAEGQKEPIRVVEHGERFRLIAGARRLAAVQSLGLPEIEAVVDAAETYADGAAMRLAEIKADMMRADLTALDHAVYVAAWCDIFRGVQGPQKPGPKPKALTTDAELDEFSAKLALNWTDAAQQALGIGRRTVFRSLKIAGIAAEQRARIALHPIASKQNELLLLADQNADRQVEVIDMLAAEPTLATSVTEALTRLDSLPAPKPVPAYARLAEKFLTFKPAEQEAFFELHAERIERWLAERRAAARKAA